MITNFPFPGQTVLTQLTLPYKLYFLVFCLVPLFTQWLTVKSLDTSLVLAATTGHAGKDLASATQGKSTSWLSYGQYSSFYIIGIVLGFFN